ncbi:hypothetical protein I302_102409 [Kwoniella bestiolae CBS 10118]|uniref:Nucleic acid-binding protein n=1 Tax=Kwoniella bestiolae CBS 10118 TaxID=1296100 RepID=A0A1B9GEX6_9TREE|nr:hypothetical protein I302_01099 [Kwoniella bestiolae CBS 10118]OCF29590.1 hypothetical protein I302_01099 [Kwoniella bestiolae CBS 10118]
MFPNLIIASSSTARTYTRAFSSSTRALDISKVILVGRLGADPILRNTSSGKPYYTYTVATNVGAPVEGEGGKLHPPPTSWHTVFSFNEFQHPALQKLGKGSTVYVEAELEMRPYEPDASSNGPTPNRFMYDRAFLKHQKLNVITRMKPESEQDGSDE